MITLESPIEDIFYWNAEKYIQPSLNLQPQVEVSTPNGKFRLDFVLRGKLRVAFECDGREFHDGFRDEFRDALILGGDHVDAIYHIPGSAIHHCIEDTFHHISQWDSWMFSDRGLVNLQILASEHAKSWTVDPRDESVVTTAGVVERRVREVPKGRRAHWTFLHQWSLEQGAVPFEELVERRRSEWGIANCSR